MLDCGGCGYAQEADLIALEDAVRSLSGSGGVDFVLLSHGDLQHVGALPLLFGSEGVLCGDQGQPPVIVCTLPVFKMTQMALYDLHVNLGMEARSEGCRSFSLDDVDHCLRNVVTVKYNQACIMGDPHGAKAGEVTFTAHASGRTIGGSVWVIRHGCAEIVYAMDTNLRKETLLEGAALDSLPQSPSLLIVESPASSASTAAPVPRRPRAREREESLLLSAVMESVRAEGNVLIPCETAGRTLELLVLLSRYWVDHNLGGMYHLVYLSPMASSTVEFARCQLEWISDSLCQGFYLGRANPLALPFVRIASSLRDLDTVGPGPKVVLATDASLNHGFAKALLLRWGGDPKCRVLFLDASDPKSLASDLRSQDGSAGPVIASVMRSERVKLSGDDLEDFLKEKEARRRIQEAAIQRRRREREITAVCISVIERFFIKTNDT
jgi:cleavage and polyadenylation specificity factor subunit 2